MDRAGRGAKPYLSPEDRAAFKQSVLELHQERSGGRIRGSDVLALMKHTQHNAYNSKMKGNPTGLPKEKVLKLDCGCDC